VHLLIINYRNISSTRKVLNNKKDRIPPVTTSVLLTLEGGRVNMQELMINPSTLEIPYNCVIVIGDGKAKLRELHEHCE
jgi:hypothetical protein